MVDKRWTRASLNDYLTTLAIQARNAVREYAEQTEFPMCYTAIFFDEDSLIANSGAVDGKYLFSVSMRNGELPRDVFGPSKYWKEEDDGENVPAAEG